MAAALSLLAFLWLSVGWCWGQTVEVSPRSCTEERGDGATTTLNSLISRGEVSSNTFYRLLPGTHCLSDFGYVQNLSNVTFSGNSSRRDAVIVNCTAGVGLAFLHVHTLVLEGLTVDGCGVTGEGRLDVFQEELGNKTGLFYQIHSTDTIAVAVGMVTDFTVRSVDVVSTAGLGLLVVNAQASTLVEDCRFFLNHPPSCYRLPLDNFTNINITENNQVGGGAYFVFVDFTNRSENSATSLLVSDSEFFNNSYCGLSAEIAVSDIRRKLIKELGYSLGAGGGLSVILAQSLYPVEVRVSSTIFKNNTSLRGGGAHLALLEGARANNVTFSNCHFLQNGLTSDIIENLQFPSHGSGFYMVRDLPYPGSRGISSSPLQSQGNQVVLQGCTLAGNRGSYSAAVNIISQYRSRTEDTVSLDNCTLTGNEAIVGAAMHIGESKQNGLQPGMKAVLRNVIITRNKIYSEDYTRNIPATSKSDTSAAVEFLAMSVSFEGESSLIADNSAAAIRSVSSVIYFYDRTIICNNSGSFGGGISLIASSYLVLKNNSHLILENNSAVVEGGALYVNLLAFSPDTSYHDCFLFFGEVDTICLGLGYCSDINSLNFTLELNHNVAGLGSLIFGSTLDTCPWAPPLRERFNRSHILDVMNLDLNNSFMFSSDPTTVNAVTTPSSRLAIHGSRQVSYSPGELFFLSVSGYDHLNQSMPLLISSKPSSSHPEVSSALGLSNFSFLDIAGDYREGDLVPVVITGAMDTDVTVYLYATDSYSHIEFSVNLTQCRTGFEYHGGRCECEPGLTQHHSVVRCNSTSMTLTVSNNKWVGPGPNGSIIVGNCISDFCRTGEREVKPPNFDLFCHPYYHRSGILCGQCAENYSMTLGSHRCLRCQNNNGLSLIILFAFGGVVIMFGILFLHITVSEGYLNSILFYTNVLSLYIPILNTKSRNSEVFVLLAWFNLDFGIEQCFYDGMTTLQRVALQLIFPFYLLLLMLLVTIVSKKSRRLSHFFSRAKFSAAKLFATILLMSYTTLLGACLELLSPVSLSSVNGDSYLSWRSDPNQPYFQGLHRYLVVLACLLLLTVVLPPPILLIFPGITFSTRLGVKIKPLLDAFWAPFKTNFRFFVGLRLLLRGIPYTTAYVIQQPGNILSLGIFAVCMLFLQVTVQPFDGFFRNTLDTFFLSNIIVLAMGALYFQISVSANEEDREYVPFHTAQFVFFTFFVTLAYVAILLVILWHVQHRFPAIRRAFLSLYSTLRHRRRIEIRIRETTPLIHPHTDSDSQSGGSEGGEEMSAVNETEGDRTPILGSSGVPQDQERPPPPVVNYSILREPLLDEGDADLVPVTNRNYIH